MTDYANPDVLATTEWVEQNLDRPGVKLVEVDVDTSAYDTGHAPGAIGFNWERELQDQVVRDIVDRAGFERLLGRSGIGNEDLVILYGDHHNWFAAYAYWLFKLYGHENVRLMNGGRVKWLAEDRPLTTEAPSITPTTYTARDANTGLRAHLPEILDIARLGNHNLVDVRSPDEFTGTVIAPPGMTETAQRGGHIPGATSVPWASAVNEDGTFKSMDELRAIYLDRAGVDPARDTIAYCRIGERSSHTWFVLKELLGLTRVKNYDGSWTEYGSVVGAPIEKGAPATVRT